MKRKLILLFLALWNLYGMAQHSFIWKIDNPLFIYSYLLEYRPGQFYFSANYRNAKNALKSDSTVLLKWNYQGDSITKVIKKDTTIFDNLFLEMLIPHTQNGFIAMGKLNYKQVKDSIAVWILGFDSALNQLWEFIYPMKKRSLEFTTAKQLPNGNWLLGFNTSHVTYTVKQNCYLMEFTENGNLQKMIQLGDTVFGYIHDVAIHPVTNNIYCMGKFHNPDDPYCMISQSWMRILDTNLNQIAFKPVLGFYDSFNGMNNLKGPFGGRWISNDTLLLSSRKEKHHNPLQDEDVCIYYMKDGDTILPYKSGCFNRNSSIDYTMWKSYDITVDGKIIQIGLLDLLKHEKTLVACYDKNLNLLYHHIFVLPDLVTNPYAVFATADSGYFVFDIMDSVQGTIHAYNKIMKFDKNGQLPGMGINEKIKVERHLVYPNPGKDYFKLVLSPDMLDNKPCILELYNINGSLQQQWTFQGYEAEMITRNLPDGLYFYRVLQNNQLIASGKWMKQ